MFQTAFTGYLATGVKENKIPLDFNAFLRVVLTDPEMYLNLPINVFDDLMLILTIPCSEAIAETQGSSIDALQNELKMRLMGPEPCSSDGESLVQCVARKMAAKHPFVGSCTKRIGPAISNVLKKGYSLPLKFAADK